MINRIIDMNMETTSRTNPLLSAGWGLGITPKPKL